MSKKSDSPRPSPKSPSREQLLDALIGIINQTQAPETPPAGFFTVKEIATRTGRSIAHTSQRLRKKVRSGQLAMRPYRILSGHRVYPVPHYGPAE